MLGKLVVQLTIHAPEPGHGGACRHGLECDEESTLMSDTTGFAGDLRLTRRKAFGLAGGLAAGATGVLAATATTTQGVEQVDWPGTLGTYSGLLPDHGNNGGLFVFDEGRRRQTLVMNSDPLAGLDGAWTAGGSTSFVRPLAGSEPGTAWDQIIYIATDNFGTQEQAGAYLQIARDSGAAYGPSDIMLPDGMAANDFGWTVSYPNPNVRDQTINRSIIGFRKRNDAVLLTFDNYGIEPDLGQIVDFAQSVSSTHTDFYSNDSILPPIPTIGAPQEVSFRWYIFDGRHIQQWPPEDADSPTGALYQDANHAFNAFYSTVLPDIGSPASVLVNGWTFANPGQAQAFGGNLIDLLGASDQANNVTRIPFDPILPPNTDIDLFGDRFVIDLGPGRLLPGEEVTRVQDRTVLSMALISPNPVPDSTTPDSDAWTMGWGGDYPAAGEFLVAFFTLGSQQNATNRPYHFFVDPRLIGFATSTP
jgi:hypothetical protein